MLEQTRFAKRVKICLSKWQHHLKSQRKLASWTRRSCISCGRWTAFHLHSQTAPKLSQICKSTTSFLGCAPIMPALPWNNASIATEPKFKNPRSWLWQLKPYRKKLGGGGLRGWNFLSKITSILHKEHLISALLTMSTQSITSAFLFSLHFSCSRVKRRDPYLTFPCKMPALPICHFFIISIEWKKVIRLKTIF